MKRKIGGASDEGFVLRVFDYNDSNSYQEIQHYYSKYQVALVRGAKCRRFGFKEIQTLFTQCPAVIKSTFTVENSVNDKKSCPESYFTSPNLDKTWYVSFIAQGNSEDASLGQLVESFREELPVQNLPFLPTAEYTSPVWIFVGNNQTAGKPRKTDSSHIVGRTEHTDSVENDGTWHLQVSGTKVWDIRPCQSSEWDQQGRVFPELCPALSQNYEDGIPRLRVCCRSGDILVINTRLWWHQTQLPVFNSRKAFCVSSLSFSYARDFFFGKGDESSSAAGEEVADEVVMKNVDGIYASQDVSAGDVVLTEDELPDCALPRSVDPNCEVVELEDGNYALVAVKDLKAGEWLTVYPSDDDDEDGDDVEGEEE